MTEGSITGSILRFAAPILVGNLFQECYNLVDMTIVGHLLGDSAIASVGAAAPIYSLVINLANGITNGFSVITAREFGAGNKEKMSRAISYSYLLTVMISAALTVISLVCLEPLLHFLNTPADAIGGTRDYLMTIMSFCVVSMLYNMFAGMFRAIGNSRIPLYFLIISTVINIGLDYTFVKYLHLGVRGAACATVIAQAVSVTLCVICVSTKYDMLLFRPKYLVRDAKLIMDMLLTGFSMGMMLAVVNIGSVALQNAVNSFGSKTVTAHIAARKFDEIFMLPFGTLAIVSSTFASQNFGAGKMDRVHKGIKTAMFIGFGWSAFAFVFARFFAADIVKALTDTSSEVIVSTATKYIHINTPFFAVLTVLLILRSSLQGLGRKVVPLIGSGVELAAKFIAVIFVAPVFGYTGICFLEPAIWIVCAAIVLIDYSVFIKKTEKKQREAEAV